jgi:hypothetical protein
MKCFKQENIYDRISKRLKEVFDTNTVEFLTRSKSEFREYVFVVKTPIINRKKQYAWSVMFPDRSYYSIDKLPDGNSLSLVVNVSVQDSEK